MDKNRRRKGSTFRQLSERERARFAVEQAVADTLRTLVRLAPSPMVADEARRRLARMGLAPRRVADLPGQTFIPGAEVSA